MIELMGIALFIAITMMIFMIGMMIGCAWSIIKPYLEG